MSLGPESKKDTSSWYRVVEMSGVILKVLFTLLVRTVTVMVLVSIFF